METRRDSFRGCRFLLVLGDDVGLAYGEKGQLGKIGLGASTPILFDWRKTFWVRFRAGFTCMLASLLGKWLSDRFLREGTDSNITGSGFVRLGSDLVTSSYSDGIRRLLIACCRFASSLLAYVPNSDAKSGSWDFTSTSKAVCLQIQNNHK